LGEMRRLFADRSEALRNAYEVAERCAGAVRLSGGTRLPAANLPEQQDPLAKLRELALRGAREKYRASKEVRPAGLKARLERELRCVGELGFAGYFLLAYEAKEIALEMGVPVTGRGSVANSLICYCLGLRRSGANHNF